LARWKELRKRVKKNPRPGESEKARRRGEIELRVRSEELRGDVWDSCRSRV